MGAMAQSVSFFLLHSTDVRNGSPVEDSEHLHQLSGVTLKET